MSTQQVAFDPSQSYQPAVSGKASFDPGGSYQAAPKESDQPSAASRLGSNFLSGAGVTSDEQAKNFFGHPLDTVIKSFEAQGQLAKKARDAYDKGDYLGALQHAANYLVPFVGQQTDQAGEQLKQGDIAGGIGRTLGAAIPIVAQSPEVQSGVSDAASAAANVGAKGVRAAARGANQVLSEAPGTVGAAAGGAIGHATGLPYAGEIGAGVGAVVGKEVLPKIQIPGEGFGLPSRVAGGPASAPEFQAPTPEVLQAKGLATGGSVPPPEPSAALGDLPVHAVQQAIKELGPQAPIADITARANQLSKQLNDALGGQPLKPNVPLKDQLQTTPTASDIPEGHTPHQSSALKSSMYNSDANEFHVRMTSGNTTYVYGDVSPEEAQAFTDADSKGKAYQQIKSGHPLVAKIVNGQRIAIKPTQAEPSTPPPVAKPRADDLTPILQESLKRVQAAAQ